MRGVFRVTLMVPDPMAPVAVYLGTPSIVMLMVSDADPEDTVALADEVKEAPEPVK